MKIIAIEKETVLESILSTETKTFINQKIKEINKEKKLDIRLDKMIEVKDKIVYQFNDELDELFSMVELRKPKLNLEEE